VIVVLLLLPFLSVGVWVKRSGKRREQRETASAGEKADLDSLCLKYIQKGREGKGGKVRHKKEPAFDLCVSSALSTVPPLHFALITDPSHTHTHIQTNCFFFAISLSLSLSVCLSLTNLSFNQSQFAVLCLQHANKPLLLFPLFLFCCPKEVACGHTDKGYCEDY